VLLEAREHAVTGEVDVAHATTTDAGEEQVGTQRAGQVLVNNHDDGRIESRIIGVTSRSRHASRWTIAR
jgi:hypothetical protein